MAVETFFLFGFRAMSDVIKEIFPPGEDNALAKIINKLESNELGYDAFLKLLESILRKFKDVAFEDKDLKFHLIKQLEPAFGYKVILNLETINPIAMTFNNNDDIFSLSGASSEDIEEFPGILFPIDIFKKFLLEDLDILKLITENKIEFEKFLELDEIIVRALLGFTSAFFLKDEFKERVKGEIRKLL